MIMTAEEAAQMWCPNAPTIGDTRGPACISEKCAAWRWVEVNVVDAAFTEAVKRCAAQIGDKSPNRKDAVALVVADRAAYGLPTEPTRGYCGLAGVPHDLPKVIR